MLQLIRNFFLPKKFVQVAAAFAFGYMGLELVVPQLKGMQLSGKLAGGMICATLVFFADLWFLFKSMLDEDQSAT